MAAVVLAAGGSFNQTGVTRTHGRRAREGEDVAEGVQDMHASHGGGGEFFFFFFAAPVAPVCFFKQTRLFFYVETFSLLERTPLKNMRCFLMRQTCGRE